MKMDRKATEPLALWQMGYPELLVLEVRFPMGLVVRLILLVWSRSEGEPNRSPNFLLSQLCVSPNGLISIPFGLVINVAS